MFGWTNPAAVRRCNCGVFKCKQKVYQNAVNDYSRLKMHLKLVVQATNN
jgi:hypothetical protein